MTNIIPNTTQIPHLIIREWMPYLSDVELRVILIIADQTLGWIEDKETGRRKEYDWISREQLIKKTGRSAKHVSKAIKTLIEVHKIIEARGENGELLDTAEKRRSKFGKIFYRLNLHHPPMTLFDLLRESKRRTVIKKHRVTKRPTQKGRTTKETRITKNNYLKTSKLDLEIKKLGNKKNFKEENNINSIDKKLPTNKLIATFNEYCQAVRGEKPVFTRFKDGNLIKHALRHLTEIQIEQLFIWFLVEKKEMKPTIGAALCKEVIADFLKQASKEYGFYSKIDGYFQRYLKREIKTEEGKNQAMVDALKNFYSSFKVNFLLNEERS